MASDNGTNADAGSARESVPNQNRGSLDPVGYHVRLLTAEKELVERFARQEGLDPTSWARRAVRRMLAAKLEEEASELRIAAE